MLKTKPAVITDVGIDMQLRNLNGETIEFTKLVVGDGVYSDSESDPEFLRKMVSLKSPKQQFGVSSISMVDNEKIAASTVITNYELEEGYTIRELGLYARIKDDPESEGLVSLSLAEIEDTFPAYDGKVVSRIISRFQFSVSDSDTVQLSYLHDPVALVEDVDAKIAVLQKAIDDATALRASLEAYGMVKLCDSEAVTDSTGLALPATEKNASIEGTLAYQLSQLNTDCKNRVLANIPNSKSNVYIKQGTDSNGENCNCMHSGFKFGIPYNYEDNAYPACGIGNMRGDSCIYLSISMMHHYDKETTVSNWICTKYYPGYYRTPIAILLNDMTFRINSVAYGPGVYILSAPNKIYELNEIIPDSDITVTKIG